MTATTTTTTMETVRDGDRLVVALGGRWTIERAAELDARLAALAPAPAVRLDMAAVEAIDTATAWVLHRTVERLEGAGVVAEIAHLSAAHKILLDLVAANDRPVECRPPREPGLVALVGHIGRATCEVCAGARDMTGFLGLTALALARALMTPWRARITSLVSHMERAGIDALPIVGLMTFLLGIVLAYQGAEQLRRFGAEIFVVDLVGIAVLREIGILITAIIVAGRSGSAFTAAIGSMMVREEIDAMRTIGLDPMEVLVLPRLLALILTLPLLAFLADLTGLLGGALFAWLVLDIAPAQFIERLVNGVSTESSFWIGIMKAPVFAFLIAMVGCYEGFRVRGSAESVGRHTTLSVVESIFLVIVVDAAFSVVFAVPRV